jgi:hypothetical protein
MQTNQIVNTSIGLSANPPAQANFGVPGVLVDHSDIPIDKRYRIISRSSKSDLTSGTSHKAWADALWSQNFNPSEAYFCRWVSSASSPYIVFSSPNETITDWTSLADGALKIVDSAAAEDTISTLSFAAVTSLDDVATVIQTALQALVGPNITGLDTATCYVDALGRIIIQNSTTGASALTISAAAPAAGTSLINASYLGTTHFSQAGLDAEAPEDAQNAVLGVDDTPFAWSLIGGTAAQVVTLSTNTNSLAKILTNVERSTDAKDSGITTDSAYQISALGHRKTYQVYTEHATQYPDAALYGEILPQTEATVNFAMTPIAGVSESGLDGDGTTVVPLNDGERSALEGKGCDYLVKPVNLVHTVNGYSAAGVSYEMRIMIGKMFCEAKINEAVYGYLVSNNVVTFSDEDIQAIGGIITYWHDEMVNRKVLQSGYTLNLPSAADFTAAEQATHIMDLDNVVAADTQRSVNRINITIDWTV